MTTSKGRPQGPETTTRSLRITPTEWAEIAEAAKATGRSTPDYIRWSCRQQMAWDRHMSRQIERPDAKGKPDVEAV